MRLPALAMVVVIAACASPSAAPSSASPVAVATTTAATPTVAPTPQPKFPHGLYIVQPALDHPGGVIEVLDGSGPLPTRVEFVGNGYDVSDHIIVAGTGPNDGLTIFGADGTKREIRVPGIYGIGRPSLSPDAKFAVVQATETPIQADAPMPKFLTDYIIDLATGNFRRLIAPGTQEFAEGRELPRWLSTGDQILYQTNDFTSGVLPPCDIVRVVDATTGATLLTIGVNGPTGCFSPTPASGPRFHAEPNLAGTQILIAGQLQVFDAKTGQVVADVRKQALDGLAAAGYKPDARFRGQGGAGTFPLDGTISPDGRTITFDGAVEKDGRFGVLLCRINIDGTGFTVVRPPVQVTPMFSNNHNYSQVLPRWR